MNWKMIAVVLSATALLVSCSGKNVNKESLSEVNKTGDIKELVQDYSVGNIKNQTASITAQQLIVTDNNGKEQAYDLPEDVFFVSIAPYVNETHPCTIHSLTGCQGELAGKSFDVYIEDMDGKVILDKTLQSQANGFIDLWLPRNNTYRVSIAHNGKEVESEISTFDSDGTCITDMKLV